MFSKKKDGHTYIPRLISTHSYKPWIGCTGFGLE